MTGRPLNNPNVNHSLGAESEETLTWNDFCRPAEVRPAGEPTACANFDADVLA